MFNKACPVNQIVCDVNAHLYYVHDSKICDIDRTNGSAQPAGNECVRTGPNHTKVQADKHVFQKGLMETCHSDSVPRGTAVGYLHSTRGGICQDRHVSIYVFVSKVLSSQGFQKSPVERKHLLGEIYGAK